MSSAIDNSPSAKKNSPTRKIQKQSQTSLGQGIYEFNAPQYYDFDEPSNGHIPSESWFEKNHSSMSPREERGAIEGTPNSHKDSLKIPATVTQNRKKLCFSAEDDSSKTVDKTSPIKFPCNEEELQSPIVVVAPTDCENVFKQEETTVLKRSTSYERLFQMTKKKDPQRKQSQKKPETTSPTAPQLGKVRTPDLIKLAKLKLSAPLLPTRSTKPLTVPVEFNFSERPIKQRSPSFQKPMIKKINDNPISNIQKNKLTIPESPMLATRQRSRADSKILNNIDQKESSKDDHLKQPLKRSKSTVPTEMKLLTTTRSNHEKDKRQKVQSTSPFRATPVPIASINNSDYLPPKKEKRPTIPITPKLHTNRSRAATAGEEKEFSPIKIHPIPESKPFLIKKTHQFTKPLPSQLPGDALSLEKRKKFQEAIKREKEALEEARHFNARELPTFTDLKEGVPLPKSRPLTRPQPFNLMTDLRYQKHHQDLEKKLKLEEERSKHEREFHSRPVPNIVPFMPHKSSKPLTTMDEVHLHSTDRALKRREFDDSIKRKEEEMKEVEREQEELQRQKEEEEMKELRKKLVPKAQPIIHYPQIVVKPSDRPLTIPKSPPLMTNQRSKKRPFEEEELDDK